MTEDSAPITPAVLNVIPRSPFALHLRTALNEVKGLRIKSDEESAADA